LSSFQTSQFFKKKFLKNFCLVLSPVLAEFNAPIGFSPCQVLGGFWEVKHTDRRQRNL
jgi:hypothetical protein